MLRALLVGAVVFGLSFTHLMAQEMPIYKWSQWYSRNSGHGIFSDHQTTTDANGNVYISGVMNAVLDADPGPGVFNLTPVNSNYDDVYIIKLNASGVFQWAHSYNRLAAQNGAGDIVVDAAGNVFFASYYQLAFATNDTRITKYDANGNELWLKIVATKGWGGREITLDQSGNLLMAGGFTGTVDFDPNAGVQNKTASTSGTNSDMFLLKLSNDGDFMWVKTAGGTGNKTPTSITRDASQNILITGNYGSAVCDFDFGAGTANLTAVGGSDVFVLKLEEDGDFIWVRSLGGTDTDIAHAIATSPSENIYVAGSFRGTGDFDPTAGTTTLSTTTDYDMFLVRLNPDGSFGWASQFGTPGNFPDEGKGLAIDAAGNILVTGQFMGTVDFDPGPGVSNITSMGTFLYGNAFVAKYTESQALVWVRAFGSGSTSSQSMGTSVDVDNAGVITVVGHSTGTFQANFGPCSNMMGGTSTTAFIVKLVLGFEAQPTVTSFSPASGTIGTTVVITGTNFGNNPADLDVRFGSRVATVTAVTPTSITTTVPAATTTSQIYVRLKCFNAVITSTNFIVGTPPAPTITSFTPASGATGTTVTITGTNFSTTPANNTVSFNGTAAVVTASTATSITTTVPTAATTGKITVTVNAVTAMSTNNFTVTTGPPPAAVITVNAQPVNETACEGDVTFFTVSASGALNMTFRWQFSADNVAPYVDISDSGPYSNTTINELEVIAGNAVAGFYRCRISGDNAANVFSNSARLTIDTQCAPPGVGDMTVYNAISPNGDDKNDILFLEFVDTVPDTQKNQVFIFNRWGDKVFSADDYDNQTRVFSGIGNDGNKLPSGVYYYKIILPDKNETLTGYLQLKF